MKAEDEASIEPSTVQGSWLGRVVFCLDCWSNSAKSPQICYRKDAKPSKAFEQLWTWLSMTLHLLLGLADSSLVATNTDASIFGCGLGKTHRSAVEKALNN